MRLILTNRYPVPYPNFEHLSAEDAEKLKDCVNLYADSVIQTIEGVSHFQVKHTITVAFKDQESYDQAKALTGWERWSDLVLEAPMSPEDGYIHPAIVCKEPFSLSEPHPSDPNCIVDVVADKVAYCGYMLEP